MNRNLSREMSRSILLFLKKHGNKILMGLSCAGVVGTAVVAVRQDRLAQTEINDIEADKLTNSKDIRTIARSDWEIDKKEKYKIYFKYHIPTALMGIGTITCILGSGYFNQRTQAGLISAYGLLNESFSDYRRKNIELYGADNHKKILDELAIERAKSVDIYSMGAFSCSDLQASSLANQYPKELFYDEYSKRYFESTLPAVIEAQYHINRNLILGAPVILNDWYSFLGLENTIPGNELGWFMCDDYCWIDFTNEEKQLADGTRYISICMDYEPDTRWQEEW